MIWARTFLLLALAVAQDAHAIDKGYFSGLKPDTAEKVLMSFWAPLYYVAGERTGELSVSIQDTKPYTSSPYKHAALLFLSRDEAMGFLRHTLKTHPDRLGIKTTNMNRIMVAQYKTRDDPASENPQRPDLVIVDTFLPMALVVEAFVDDQQNPYVHQLKGKQFVPAFLSRNDAIAFEDTVKKSGKGKFARRGLDFRSHLKFVEALVNSSTPVVTFGGDVYQVMNHYVDSIAK